MQQFIFGDNTSKYTLLYFDDKPEVAAKIKDMIRIPYSPSERFNSYGFIPFGSNSNRTLFFKFQKDTKMIRNVYILHGVYSDIDKEYFYGNEYLKGLSIQFIDQEKFDVLRDQVLDGKKDCEVAYGYDASLAADDCSSVKVEKEVFYDIISRLYQRTKVLVVMDDEKFTDDYVRLFIKKIFAILPPSLRKVCSFITAVDKTGDMDFMLRIIPRSMLQKGEKYIDVDQPYDKAPDKSGFPDIVAKLGEVSAIDKNALAQMFESFEVLTYGRDSIYKKADFQQFFNIVFDTCRDDDEKKEYCERLLGDYLCDDKCPDEPAIPAFIKKVLTPYYSSEEFLNKEVNLQKHCTLDKLDKFYDDYIDIIKKVYYLADKKLGFFDKYLTEGYIRAYTSDKVAKLNTLLSMADDRSWKYEDTKTSERALYDISLKIENYLENICDKYANLFNEAAKHFQNKEQTYYGINAPIENVDSEINNYKAVFALQIEELRQFVTDIDKHFGEKIKAELFDVHNEKCYRLIREENERKDTEFKNSVFTVFEAAVKANADKLTKVPEKKAKKQSEKKEQAAETQEESIYDGTDDVRVDEVFADEDSTIELPDPSDLQRVAEDERWNGSVSKLVCDYVLNVCMPNPEMTFVNGDPILKLTGNAGIAFKVFEDLCSKYNRADAAILFYASAQADVYDALKTELRLKSVDNLSSKDMALVKKLLPAVLNSRMVDYDGYSENIGDIINSSEKILEGKEYGAPRKELARIIGNCALVRGAGAVDNAGGNKKLWLMVGIAGALIIIGVIVALIVFGGGSDKDKDKGKGESESTAVTTLSETDEKTPETTGDTQETDKTPEDTAGETSGETGSVTGEETDKTQPDQSEESESASVTEPETTVETTADVTTEAESTAETQPDTSGNP